MGKRIHFLHHSPGRIRIQVDGLKGNQRLSGAIHSLTNRVKGIEQITASTITGSVLICYDKKDPQVLQRLEAMIDDAETLLTRFSSDPAAFAKQLSSSGSRP